MTQQKIEAILSPYRVLDLTEDGCMLCGKVLGDLGADVIEIEPPAGSPTRNTGPFYHDTTDAEKSLTWFFLGLNKRGVTLNLDTADGREIFKRLVKTADFVVESFEPGYMKSLGLDYEELVKIKPDIVMTSITPFGQTGPYAHYKVRLTERRCAYRLPSSTFKVGCKVPWAPWWLITTGS